MNNLINGAKYSKRIFLRAGSADPSPPLGTVLGNLGVNTVSFCTSFNLFTKSLPNYFVLKVNIFVYENRSTSFVVDLPSTGHFINLLKFEKVIKVRVFDKFQDKNVFCINLLEVIKLALLKFPQLPLCKSILIIWGTVKAMNLNVI